MKLEPKLFDLCVCVDDVKSGFVQIVRDNYWLVTDTGKMIYCGTIQCNRNKDMCESMVEFWLTKFNMVVHVEFHPLALVPVHLGSNWEYSI